MNTTTVLMEDAKCQIRGSVGTFAICSVITSLINVMLSKIPYGSIGCFVFSGAWVIALTRMHLGLAYGKPVKVGDLFCAFKEPSALVNALIANVLNSLMIMLWSLLLVIPGIIKAFSLSMTFFILADNPEMAAYDAMKASEKMMDGHKAEYFGLLLAFIPWYLIILVTCGLASIYYIPCMNQTTTNFYLGLKTGEPFHTDGKEEGALYGSQFGQQYRPGSSPSDDQDNGSNYSAWDK